METVGSVDDRAAGLQRVRSLTRDLDVALEDVLDNIFDPDPDFDRDFDVVLALARDFNDLLISALDFDPALVVAAVTTLAQALKHAGTSVRANVFVSAHARPRVSLRALDAKVADCMRIVLEIVDELKQVGLASQEALSQGLENRVDGERKPWLVAVWVTGQLVRVLPVADQSLYREIYESELFDLAQTRRPRRAQFAYTVRSLAGVLSLRHTLRMPMPQPSRQGR